VANLAEVNLPGKVDGLERKGSKLVKVYGNAAPAGDPRLPAIFVH
jgi:hypothetical protein